VAQGSLQVKLHELKKHFACVICGRIFRCECGYVATGLIIAGIVVAAAGAAYGAVSASEAQQQQASMAKKAAQQQADAEAQAGEARARQIQYNADKMKRSFLSREAGAGVQVGQGSLLETESQFAFDTEYSKQLAKYPHELAGASDQYQADLFGFTKKQAASNEVSGSAIAGISAGAKAYAGSSLATSGSGSRIALSDQSA
jgi:hypothetical protein